MLQELVGQVQPGMTTGALDEGARTLMKRAKVTPAFLGYHGFPAVICTSVNAQVVHGIPSDRCELKDGDILGLDIGIVHERLYTDMAVTVPVGKVDDAAARLLRATRTALDRAVRYIRPGRTTGDLGAEIQSYVESEGFSVVRDLVGHGVGGAVHEDPMIPNFGVRGQGPAFAEGMVIAVEPMVTAGGWHVRTEKDGWTVTTLDGSLAAHFEHTLILTKDGADVITQTDGDHPWP